jgi:hypothetical protein
MNHRSVWEKKKIDLRKVQRREYILIVKLESKIKKMSSPIYTPSSPIYIPSSPVECPVPPILKPKPRGLTLGPEDPELCAMMDGMEIGGNIAPFARAGHKHHVKPVAAPVGVVTVGSKNPIPPGTQYTVLLPWVDRRISEGFLFAKFRNLDWGRILRIDMLWKRDVDGKPGHYKVFIHLGELNPCHEMVFKHLDSAKNELKVHYNEKFYWKVRKSTWTPHRSGIGVEFVTKT